MFIIWYIFHLYNYLFEQFDTLNDTTYEMSLILNEGFNGLKSMGFWDIYKCLIGYGLIDT